MGNAIKSRILLVEDEPALRTGTEQFLRQRGFTVLTAASGEEALEKFARADVIILDIMLPGMSGIEVLHQIRQTSDVPVLMLTALHDEPTQVASFDELADDYISKHGLKPLPGFIGNIGITHVQKLHQTTLVIKFANTP